MDNTYKEEDEAKQEEEATDDDSCKPSSQEAEEPHQFDSEPTCSVQTLTIKQTQFSTTTTTSSSGQISICSVREEVKPSGEKEGENQTQGSDDGMIPKDQTNMGSDDTTEPYTLIQFADEKKILLSKMGHQEFLFDYQGHPEELEHLDHHLDDLDEAASLNEPEEEDDSSDLLDSDSEDEYDDVISIPLRGRCIQYLRHAICRDPCYHCLKTSGPTKASGKCKTIDAYCMDFKLKVLEWAYSKSIHSAGHHFNLERCVVRNWMMNEEKIFLLASSKGRRKWARYDSGKKDSNTRYSRANLDLRLVKGLGGLKVSGNGGGSRS